MRQLKQYTFCRAVYTRFGFKSFTVWHCNNGEKEVKLTTNDVRKARLQNRFNLSVIQINWILTNVNRKGVILAQEVIQ